MILRPPRSTRTDTLFPDTARFRSDTGRVSLAAGEGMSGWLDRLLIPGRLLRTGWDPEGVLSTLSAIATALIGAAVQRARLRTAGRSIAAIDRKSTRLNSSH